MTQSARRVSGYGPRHRCQGEVQFSYWREVISQAFARVLPTRQGGGAFRAILRSRQFGVGQVTHIEAQALHVFRGPREICSSPTESYYVLLQLSGMAIARQHGREGITEPGGLMLIDPMAPFEVKFPHDFSRVCLHVPRQLIDRYVRRPHAVTAVPVHSGHGAVTEVAAAGLRSSLNLG